MKTVLLALIFGHTFSVFDADAQFIFQRTIQIGSHIWMGQNLSVTHFQNGNPIPYAGTTEEWSKAALTKQPAWCFDRADKPNQNSVRLYNWYAITDPRGFVPQGWKIPSNADWDLSWGELKEELYGFYAPKNRSHEGYYGTNEDYEEGPWWSIDSKDPSTGYGYVSERMSVALENGGRWDIYKMNPSEFNKGDGLAVRCIKISSTRSFIDNNLPED